MYKLKSLILFLTIIISTSAKSQLSNYKSFGIGLVKIKENCYNAKSDGLSVYFNYKLLHLKIATNFAVGDGEYLEYKTDETYIVNKKKFTSFDLGLNFIPFKENNKCTFIITPNLGIVSTKNIYNDPVAFKTYYYGKSQNNMNFGLNIGIVDKTNKVEFTLGTGTEEMFSFLFGICF